MKLIYLFIILIMFTSCSVQKSLKYESDDILKCDGVVYYEFNEQGFKKDSFAISKKSDIEKLCKLLKNSDSIGQGPNPPYNSTVNFCIYFKDGTHRELNCVNLIGGATHFDVMDSCDGNKWRLGSYTNNDLDDYFIELLKGANIDITTLN